MAEISVIVPVYRAEACLTRCVDSILNQTFSDFELILVDDGSPDGCPAICDAYAEADQRVRVLHQKNSGPSIARNNGIDWAFEYSSSRYLAFVDSDDVLHPQCLEFLLRGTENQNTKISMCHHRYIASGEQLEAVVPHEAPSTREISAEDLMVEQWSSFNYVWGKLYAKECFQTLRYPENVSFGEDNLIIFQAMFQAGRIAYIDNDLYYYFYTPTGITKSPWTPKSLDVFQGIQAQLAYYEKNGYHKAYEKELELYIQQYAYQIHRIQGDKVNRKANRVYQTQMRQEMNTLLKANPQYNVKENMFWYEALCPVGAKITGIIRRVGHNVKENGLKGTLMKVIRKVQN